MRTPACLACVVLLVSACLDLPPLPVAAQLTGWAVDPLPLAPDRVARLPTVTLRFDLPLALPPPDAVWLLRTQPSSALASEAHSVALSAANLALRIPASIAFDPADPTAVGITPRDPLLPDDVFVLVTTAALVTPDGAPAGQPGQTPGPIQLPFRVAPPPQCPALARLAFPLAAGVPLALDHVTVGFDRPLQPRAAGVPAVVLTDPTGLAVPAMTILACGSDALGYTCAEVRPAMALQPAQTYALGLGPLLDAGGLGPQAVALGFTTQDTPDPPSPPTPAAEPVVCALDEAPAPPFCTRVTAAGIEVRGALDSPGALRASAVAGAVTAESTAGTSPRVQLAGLAPDRMFPVTVWPLALDGIPRGVVNLGPIATAPTLPRFRITEVLAHPRGVHAQQFVEVLNTGDTPADLGGLVLATPTGASVLPAASVAPGARAVITGGLFDPRGDARGDPPVAPGTLLVQLGTDSLAGRGLSETGADVWLADGAGHEITRVPSGDPARPPRTGVSLVRADPRMREDDPASWSYDALGDSTPGLPDRIR